MLKKVKNFIILFFITLFFSSNCLSNDIKDFEIAGISLGQSLLEYVDENKISSLKSESQYPNDKYIRYTVTKILSIKDYDVMNVLIKKNDPNYIIESISAGVAYNELEECLSLKKEIQNDIESIFDANEKQDTEFPSKQDPTGDSTVYGVQYYTKPYPSNEGLSVNCYHMTKKIDIQRLLRVTVNSEEYAYFLVNEAYN